MKSDAHLIAARNWAVFYRRASTRVALASTEIAMLPTDASATVRDTLYEQFAIERARLAACIQVFYEIAGEDMLDSAMLAAAGLDRPPPNVLQARSATAAFDQHLVRILSECGRRMAGLEPAPDALRRAMRFLIIAAPCRRSAASIWLTGWMWVDAIVAIGIWVVGFAADMGVAEGNDEHLA